MFVGVEAGAPTVGEFGDYGVVDDVGRIAESHKRIRRRRGVECRHSIGVRHYLEVPYEHIDDARANARHQIIKHKPFCPPHAFYHTAKLRERKHIEEYVHKARVDKHISYKLQRLEILRLNVVQRKGVVDVEPCHLH